ncbi:MAG: hypothetical protein JW772_01380 [Candidatus Diapherotrites archaeon]|nr:hypothetical protein [Candidatus Diapherotrites archaeon]
MIVTVFLGVLILALVLGNGLLFFIPKHRGFSGQIPLQGSGISEETAFIDNRNPEISKLVMDERISLLNRRLERIEQILLRLNGKEYSGKVSPAVARKIVALEDYKRNSHIEIQALKERMDSFDRHLNISSKRSSGKEVDISDERLRDMVFNKG